jgi:hypothetical protein
LPLAICLSQKSYYLQGAKQHLSSDLALASQRLLIIVVYKEVTAQVVNKYLLVMQPQCSLPYSEELTGS